MGEIRANKKRAGQPLKLYIDQEENKSQNISVFVLWLHGVVLSKSMFCMEKSWDVKISALLIKYRIPILIESQLQHQCILEVYLQFHQIE